MQMELINNDNTTMSSREIAEITGKRHDHVCRDIIDLDIKYHDMSLPRVGESDYRNARGKTYREFHLSKMQCFDLMTGYSTELRIRVNRRWEELEKVQNNSLPDFTNPVEAARAWANVYEKRQIAEQKIIELQPKADLADKAIRDEDKHYSIRDAGKQLGLRQSEIFDILRSKRMLTVENLPTQRALDAGILQYRTNTCPDGKNRPQAIMTMKNIFNFKERFCK